MEFTLGLPEYETGPMDRFANMSFRNVIEGRQRETHTFVLVVFFHV